MKKLLAFVFTLILALGIGSSAEGQIKDQNQKTDGFDSQTLYEIGYALKHISPVTSELNDMTLKCLWASAELGNGEAMLQLGEMYLAGRVPLEAGQDTNQEALKWWNMAWENGCARAYHNLGLMYYGVSVPGTGGAGVGVVDQDYEKAFQYFKAAADLDDTKAIRYTGICYENGHGVGQDYAMAANYYQKIGGYYLANLLLNGKGIGQDVNRAIEIYKEVAVQSSGGSGDQLAAMALALIYDKGLYIEADQVKAIEYYQVAAINGSTEAKSKLADYAVGLYKDGYALLETGNYESAFPLLLRSAQLGNTDALKMTGTIKR
jgi:TPR repeat protein